MYRYEELDQLAEDEVLLGVGYLGTTDWNFM